MRANHIRRLGDPGCDELTATGGKGASLSRLTQAALAVPPGFVVCAGAFAAFLDEYDLRRAISELLTTLDVNDGGALADATARIREMIETKPVPTPLAEEIEAAYHALAGGDGAVAVAVRSSAVAEDSGTASFAGQQATFLNVSGAAAVVDHVRRCWASFFDAGALFYRRAKGSLDDLAIAVVVQRLITPEKAGVLFTIDPVSKRRDRMTIEAIWGFGEALVSGQVVPDSYQVTRPAGEIVRAVVPPKPLALSRSAQGDLIEVAVPPERVRERVLTDAEVAELVTLGERVEAFFGAPQDIEWAFADQQLSILQSRPITTI